MPIERLPASWRPFAYRVRKWAKGDGPVFAIASGVSAGYATAYLELFRPYKPAFMHPIEDVIDTHAWGFVWAMTFIMCGLMVFSPDGPVQAMIITWWGALMLLWGSSYIISWIEAPVPYGLPIGLVHIFLPLQAAWAVWRGHRSELLIKKVRHATDPI